MQREAIVGSRTTLDVLNAEQELLELATTLVQAWRTVVTASYPVAARDRAADRPGSRPAGATLRRCTAYYNAVRNRWSGLGRLRRRSPAPLRMRK